MTCNLFVRKRAPILLVCVKLMPTRSATTILARVEAVEDECSRLRDGVERAMKSLTGKTEKLKE